MKKILFAALALFSLAGHSQEIINELETHAKLTLSSRKDAVYFKVHCTHRSGILGDDDSYQIRLYDRKTKFPFMNLVLENSGTCKKLQNLADFFYRTDGAKM